jgi:hypothetical protein
MVEFERYASRLREFGWDPDQNLADHVARKGHSLSHVPFIKAVLAEEVGREDGPLSGMELQYDAYEMTILDRVIDRIIDEYL